VAGLERGTSEAPATQTVQLLRATWRKCGGPASNLAFLIAFHVGWAPLRSALPALLKRRIHSLTRFEFLR
jgi:hypothetical protein